MKTDSGWRLVDGACGSILDSVQSEKKHPVGLFLFINFNLSQLNSILRKRKWEENVSELLLA